MKLICSVVLIWSLALVVAFGTDAGAQTSPAPQRTSFPACTIAAAAAACPAYPCLGYSTGTADISGVFSGQVDFRIIAVTQTPPANGFTPTSSTGVTSATSPGVYNFSLASGFGIEIVGHSGWTSGTATINWSCSEGNLTLAPGSSGGGATPIPTPPGGIYPVTVVAPTDAGGNVKVVEPAPSATYLTNATVVNTPGVNVQNFEAPVPVVTASAGASPVASAGPVVAFPHCVYPLGAIPVLTVGNTIVQQCDVNGRLQVVTPAPCATPTCNNVVWQGTSPWTVNTPAPGPTVSGLPAALLIGPSTAPAAAANVYQGVVDSNGRQATRVCDATTSTQCLAVSAGGVATVTTPAPLPTLATFLYPGVVVACPSAAPAAVNSTYTCVHDSTGNTGVVACTYGVTPSLATCVSPTTAPPTTGYAAAAGMPPVVAVLGCINNAAASGNTGGNIYAYGCNSNVTGPKLLVSGPCAQGPVATTVCVNATASPPAAGFTNPGVLPVLSQNTCTNATSTTITANASAPLPCAPSPAPAGVPAWGYNTSALPAAPILCNKSVRVAGTAVNTLTQIVALSGTTLNYICGWQAGQIGTVLLDIQLSVGTGTNCATTNVILDEAIAASSTNMSYTSPYAFPLFTGTAVSQEICVDFLATTSTTNSITVYYSQF